MDCFKSIRKTSLKSVAGLVLFLLLSINFNSYCDELIIISPHWEGYKREFEWGFIDWYKKKYRKDVIIRWVDLGGTSDALRYILSQREKANIDIFFGGGIEPFLELKRQKMLQRISLSTDTLSLIPESVGGNRVYDEDGYWYSTNLAGFGIIYNKVLLEKLKVAIPTSWNDLTKPELKGWISTADPRKSGSIRFVYEVLLQFFGWEKGWELLYGIGHNVRSFSAHSSQTPKDIAMGEIAAGIVIDSYARDLIRSVGEKLVGFTIPDDFKPVVGDGIGVLSGAPHFNVANAFIEFTLSSEAQALLMKRRGVVGGPKQYELGRMSVLPSLYEGPRDEYIDTPNPFTMKTGFKFDFNKASRRWAVLTDLIGATIIDPVSQLRKKESINELSPPMSEDDVDHIVVEKLWDNTETRDRILNDVYRNTINSSGQSKNSVLQNLPIILFLTGMLGILFFVLKDKRSVVNSKLR